MKIFELKLNACVCVHSCELDRCQMTHSSIFLNYFDINNVATLAEYKNAWPKAFVNCIVFEGDLDSRNSDSFWHWYLDKVSESIEVSHSSQLDKSLLACD